MASSVVENCESYLMEMDDSGGWQYLFEKLRAEAITNRPSTAAAKRVDNKNRNRYRDVLPADATRFKLTEGDNDYINANYVKVPSVSRCYILAQGPLPHTAEHFWQMVWEENTRGVAMLNRTVEKGTRKCHQYWPLPSDSSLIFGNFEVTLERSESHQAFVINHLDLKKLNSEDDSRKILHFHYTDWPDFGVPQTAEAFLNYLWAVRDSGSLDDDVGSLVVHCSAGIGRSGTFCLADVCLRQVELTGSVDGSDIESHLLQMRTQRFGLVQTSDQLRFAYMAIAEGMRRIDPELLNQAQVAEENWNEAGPADEELAEMPAEVRPTENSTSAVIGELVGDTAAESMTEAVRVPTGEATEVPAIETAHVPEGDTVQVTADKITPAPTEEAVVVTAEEATQAPTEEATNTAEEEAPDEPVEEVTEQPAEEPATAEVENATNQTSEEPTEVPSQVKVKNLMLAEGDLASVDDHRMSPLKRPMSSDDEVGPPRKQPVPLNGSGPAAGRSSALATAQSGTASVQEERNATDPSEDSRANTAPVPLVVHEQLSASEWQGRTSSVRERRQQNLQEKVASMKQRAREHEASKKSGYSWSSYIVLPLAAFAIVGGAYAVYRIFS